MKPVSKSDYIAALKVVADYAEAETVNAVSPTQIGARVKLSAWGLEMQGARLKKLTGTVISYLPWMNFPNDGTVTVLWDGQKKHSDMHVSQIELIKNDRGTI